MKTWADVVKRRAERGARFARQRAEIDVHMRELPRSIADALACPEGCLDVTFAIRESAFVVMTVTLRTRHGSHLAKVEVLLRGRAELNDGPLWEAALSGSIDPIILAPGYAKLVEAISEAAFTEAARTPEKALIEPAPHLTPPEPTAGNTN